MNGREKIKKAIWVPHMHVSQKHSSGFDYLCSIMSGDQRRQQQQQKTIAQISRQMGFNMTETPTQHPWANRHEVTEAAHAICDAKATLLALMLSM